MKQDGYFVECCKCGGNEIKKSEPIMNNRTHKIKQTLSCLRCKREVIVEK